MEQASGRIMTGIRAFFAHLPLTSLLWLSYCSSVLRLFSGEYRWLVRFLYYDYDYDDVKDIYDNGGLLCTV